jgi:hypothetical protein
MEEKLAIVTQNTTINAEIKDNIYVTLFKKPENW